MHKTAVVTGGARGIGAAISRALAHDGWRVVINYHSSEREALSLAAELGGEAVRADVSDEEEARALFDRAGGAALLVNNAGIAHYGLMTETSALQWRRLPAVNVEGTANCCRLALPYMIRERRGCIINVSSVWGLRGASCEAAYSASKAAVIGLTKALSKEVSPSGVRVNCIAPGVIDTDMLGGFSVEEIDELVRRTGLGRLGEATDVAALAAFLASDAAGFITGQVIGVDGGFE